MNENKRLFWRVWISTVLLIFSFQSFAQTEEVDGDSVSPAGKEQQVQEGAGRASTFLGDRLNQIDQTLQSVTSVHHYRFISLRGQDVLLATPEDDESNPEWTVEYQIDEGEWKTKELSGPEVIRDLKPGARINIRVLAKDGARFENANYRIVLGSYPHMRYELHHEDGLLKIPDGLTLPPFLTTQAYTRALLEVTFTDSKAYPLAGGVMNFRLKPHDGYKEIHEVFTSDSRGRISRFIEFGRCEGGELAGSFVHPSTGRNTWSTRYKVGKYSASNVLPGRLEDKPHEYAFGHICKRSLIN